MCEIFFNKNKSIQKLTKVKKIEKIVVANIYKLVNVAFNFCRKIVQQICSTTYIYYIALLKSAVVKR